MIKRISTYKKFTEELKSPRLPFSSTTKELVRKHFQDLKLEGRTLSNLYKNSINDILKLLSNKIGDVNNEYQLPLSLLYQTGKFGIKKIGDNYYSNLLTNRSKVLDEEGNWSFVNKLNTNYSDLLDFIVDYVCQTGKIRDVLNTKTLSELIKYLESKKTWFVDDFKEYFDPTDLYNYTQNAQKNTKTGEESEELVIKFLENCGIKILYQGGNGDYIDMFMGVDLIGEANGNIYTFQVKTTKNQILSAIENKDYAIIDVIIRPNKDVYEAYIQGKFYTFNKRGFTIPYPGKPLLMILKNPVGI